MHILLAIIGILSAAAIWWWRLKMMGAAARDVAKGAKTVANMPRRFGFQRRANRGALDASDDPREAAMAIMLEVAKAAEAPGETQTDLMIDRARRTFSVTEAEAEEYLHRANWFVRQARTPDQLIRRMAGVLRKTVGPEQHTDVAEILEDLALADGQPTPEQTRLIGVYLRAVGIRVG